MSRLRRLRILPSTCRTGRPAWSVMSESAPRRNNRSRIIYMSCCLSLSDWVQVRGIMGSGLRVGGLGVGGGLLGNAYPQRGGAYGGYEGAGRLDEVSVELPGMFGVAADRHVAGLGGFHGRGGVRIGQEWA